MMGAIKPGTTPGGVIPPGMLGILGAAANGDTMGGVIAPGICPAYCGQAISAGV